MQHPTDQITVLSDPFECLYFQSQLHPYLRHTFSAILEGCEWQSDEPTDKEIEDVKRVYEIIEQYLPGD